MECLGFKPGAAGWQVQTKPRSYGGHPIKMFRCTSVHIFLFLDGPISDNFSLFCLLNTVDCRCLDSNCGSLVSEATALPTEAQPLPHIFFMNLLSFELSFFVLFMLLSCKATLSFCLNILVTIQCFPNGIYPLLDPL